MGSGTRIRLLTIFILMLVMHVSQPTFAQSPEALSGDAYFEFAFRDRDNILSSGHLGDGRLAQSSETDDGRLAQLSETDDGRLAQLSETDDGRLAQSSKTGDGRLAQSSETDDGRLAQSSRAGEADDSALSVGQGMQRVPLLSDNAYRVSDLTLNCDHEACTDPELRAALLRATGLELGHLTSATDLALSVERLRKTGYFCSIHQSLSVQGDRVGVTFDAVPQTRIRKLVIEDSGELYESELKKRMILRPGAPLYPRTALLRNKNPDDMSKDDLISMAIEDQISSLQKIYVKEGYFDAQVSIQPVEVAPNLVDLHIDVQQAHGYVLGKIYARGHKVQSYADIESEFRSSFSLFGHVSKSALEDAASALVQRYREAGYYQARIDYVSRRNRETHTIDVFLDIDEGLRWRVEFVGNDALSSKELSAATTFQSSGYVDSGELEASREAIVNTYVSAGYYHAQAQGEIVRTGSSDDNVVIFHVKEGSRVEIGEIQFNGAAALSRDELLGIISSHEYSALGSGAYPQRAMIADDANKIVDAYRERGYLNADVTGWMLEPMESKERVRLTFVVREGKRSHFGSRQIRYTDREMYENYDVLIDAPKNDVFSDYAFRAERAAITKQLRARGHATISDAVTCTSYTEDGAVASEETCEIAELSSACMPDDLAGMCHTVETRSGETEICKRHFETEYGIEGEPVCEPKNGITGTLVDVEYNVTLGPKFAFGDIFKHGNIVTRDWVVNQDIPFESGDIFDLNQVIEARSLLRRRTIYKSASLNSIGVDDGLTQTSELGDSTSIGERSVPLVVNIEEGERRWLDFALGVSLTGGDWILTGEMEFVEANLLGTGWDLRLLVMPEARFLAGNQEFVFTQKFNQNFFTLLSLSIPVIPKSGFNIVSQLFYDLRYIPDTNKEAYGWLLELQWNVSSKWFAALAFELESSNTSSFGSDVSDDIAAYQVCYPVTFFMDCPFASQNQDFTVSISPRMSFDGRDSPVVPKYGFYAEGKIKLAYSNAIGVYAMPEARVSYVHTFLQYFTAAFNLRFGVSFHRSGERIPLIDRYFLGGLNMRGYDNEALGPRLVNALAPNVATNEAGGGEVLFNFTAELRYPIWNSIGLYGAIFTDIGALTAYQPTHYSASGFAHALFVDEMRYTAGIGLRWQIAESIPPIVIDYGFILNRRRGDPLGNFSLNIGYSF